MKKIPFYPGVVHWWRDMNYESQLYTIRKYWGNIHTVENISNNLIYSLFLNEMDFGNVNELYTKDVVWN